MTKDTIIKVGLLLSAATLFFSCFDKSYDLEDIDLTIGGTADITIPLSSTGNILLKDLMDLEDDGVVQFITDDGGNEYFAVIQDGKADIAPLEIDEIRVSANLSDIDTHVDLSTFYPDRAVSQNSRRRIAINTGNLHFNVDDASYEYEVKEKDNAKSTFTNAQTDINKDVRSLEHITIRDNKAKLNVFLPELPDWFDYFHLEKGSLSVPGELEIASCVFTAYGEGDKVVRNTITQFETDAAKGLTIIPLTETGFKINAKKGVELDFTFKGASTGRHFVFKADAAADRKRGTVTVNGDFEVKGIFRLSTADIDETKLNRYLDSHYNLAQQIQQENSLECVMPKNIHVMGKAKMDDIAVTHITGILRHDIAAIEPIRLDDMPDFLNDPDVVLDLENPVILLKAISAIPAMTQTGLTLSSIVDKTTNTIKANEVNISKGTNLYYMANNEPEFLPEEYKKAERVGITGSVASLIKKIPEQISVGIDPVTLSAKDFDITKKYDLDVEYKIFAPLTIGENFTMVYRDTERHWMDDLEDLEDLDLGMIEMRGKVDSDMPARITLTMIPIDEYGNRITAIKVNSAQAPANAKDYDIVMTLEPAPGHKLNDALAGKNGVNKLDGMTYEARIDEPIKGETIRKTAHIRIHDIKTTVKGGFTYDAN